MEIFIKDHPYIFSENVLLGQSTRESYFKLANTVFGLKFETWYNSGFWDDHFIPYVLYDNGVAVSSVGVCINDISFKNIKKRYVQMSTVMTLPEYRKRGLNQWLISYVLQEWQDKCEAIYLLANDSVVDFYPQFGFEEFTEYDFVLPIKRTKGTYRRLDINNKDDLNLILKQYRLGNPYASLQVNNRSIWMFHCLNFHSNHIFYIQDDDAVAIVTHNGNKMICYDICTGSNRQLCEILGVLAKENTAYVYVGFTPKTPENCTIEQTKEENHHLFVLAGKENIFQDHQVMFPLLSRA